MKANNALCTLCHRKGKKLFFMYFTDFWWVNRFRIAASLCKRMHLHMHRHTLALCCSTIWGVPDLFVVMVKLVWNVPTSLHRPAKLEIFLFFPSSFTYSSVYARCVCMSCVTQVLWLHTSKQMGNLAVEICFCE